MKTFGGPVVKLDRNDINTDEIIPAIYLAEISKTALRPHLLEDLLLDGKQFDPAAAKIDEANVVLARTNFGCGSSREHAVWAFEVNGINVIIAESFARIFRQNMFNCGILAIELESSQLDALFKMSGRVRVEIDLEKSSITAESNDNSQEPVQCQFHLNQFDRDLVKAGGWLAYADQNY